ncbi:glycosyltransferase family 4 protein [Vibrio splendidus]
MKDILCIGPLPPPITGQSFAFESFIENSKHNITVVNVNLEGKSVLAKVITSIGLVFEVLILLLRNDFHCLYFTSSRSVLGFLLDSIFIMQFRVFSRKGKVVNHLHGADFANLCDKRGMSYLVRSVYNTIDESIVLSKAMTNQYRQFLNMKTNVVSNFSSSFIDSEKLIEKKREFQRGSELNILYLSNLMYSKGVLDLVYAVSSLNEKGYKVNLILAGDFLNDDYMTGNELKEIVDAKLTGKIRYVGVLTGSDKEEVLEKSHVFCLPTFYKSEAQPISIIEAMAYSNLVLTTRHNFNEDFLGEDECVFFEKKNQEALGGVIKDVFDNRGKYQRNIENGYRRAILDFSLSNHVTSIDKILGD